MYNFRLTSGIRHINDSYLSFRFLSDYCCIIGEQLFNVNYYFVSVIQNCFISKKRWYCQWDHHKNLQGLDKIEWYQNTTQQAVKSVLFFGYSLYKSCIVLLGRRILPRTMSLVFLERCIIEHLNEPWITSSIIIYVYTDMVNMQSQTTAIWINVSSLHFSYPYVFLFKMQNANIYSRYKKRQDTQLSFSW